MEPEELEQLTPQELLELISSFPPEWDEYLDWFMYKFSVLSSSDNWTFLKQHEDTLKDEAFVTTALPQLFDKIESKYYLETLNIFACLDGFEQVLASNGVSGLIVRAMAQVLDKKKPSRCGCKIIASLCVDDQVRFFFGKPNRLTTRIKEVLFKYPQHAPTQLDVMRAIINISFRSKQAKHHFLTPDSKVLEVLFQTAHTHSADKHLVITTLYAIRNLVTLETLDTTKDAVPLIFNQTMKILSDHNDPHVQASALWVLVVLLSDRPSYKESFVTRNGISTLFSMLEAYPDDAYSMEPCVILLGLLAKIAKTRKAIFHFAKHKKYINFGPLFQQISSEDEVIVAAALRALFRLSFHEETRLYLGNIEVISAVCSACKANPGPAVSSATALFLRQLAKTLTIEKLLFASKTLILETGASSSSHSPHCKKLWGPLQDIALGKLEQQRAEAALQKEHEENKRKAELRMAQEAEEQRKLQEKIEQQKAIEKEKAIQAEKERAQQDQKREEEQKKRRLELQEEERRQAKLAEEAEIKRKEELRQQRLAQEKELEEKFERERLEKEAERQKRAAEAKKLAAQKAAEEEQKQNEIRKRMEEREKQRELQELKWREEKRLADQAMAEAVKQALLKRKAEQERLEKEAEEDDNQMKQEREKQRQKMLEDEQLRKQQDEEEAQLEKQIRQQRRAEMERIEEQQKRLQAQKSEAALQKQAERIKNLDLKFSNEAKRRENLRNFVREKEAEQERLIISARMKAREEKRKQLEQEKAALLAHSREFAERRYREGQAHDELKLQDLLTKSHQHAQQTTKREELENTNTTLNRNQRRQQKLEELERQQQLFRQQADEKRAERAKFRAFCSIRGLLGENVQLDAVEQQTLSAAANKRRPKVETVDQSIKTRARAQEEYLQKHSTQLQSQLTSLKSLDEKRKIEEQARQQARDAINAQNLRDETNFSAAAYLDNWRNLREERRRERK